ncbi:MAG: hypothetical protein ACLSAH_11180 [Bilophila wadsworthia]
MPVIVAGRVADEQTARASSIAGMRTWWRWAVRSLPIRSCPPRSRRARPRHHPVRGLQRGLQ